MSALHSSQRRLLGAALLAGLSVAVVFVVFSWGRLFLTNGSFDGPAGIVLGVLIEGTVATAWFVPFLLAVLIVVAAPSRRTVAIGAALVYGVDLLSIVGRTLLDSVPVGITPVVLAVPLASVANFLAIATAVWLAYHGGYERLAAAVGSLDRHPLLAASDARIGAALSVQRRPVVAGIAALVGAGGRALINQIGELFRTLARSGSSGSTSIVFSGPQVWSVGIPPARLPVEWLFEASFLLAVLFVTGPRIEPRDLLAGVVVIFGVHSTVTLLPALVPPSRPVDVWAVSGPVLTPFGDLSLFVALALAVWLAFHGGLETLERLPPSRSVHESE